AFAVSWADGARKGVKNFRRVVIRFEACSTSPAQPALTVKFKAKKARLVVKDRQKKEAIDGLLPFYVLHGRDERI
ncbi:MAG: hypothetical protein IJS21_05520, partial [Deltaproteobacteria bacterium]|nr:hypothetical protein [Deltaproteobacteria bacterium]